MRDEENVALKNKVAELKERLGQIYTQSSMEAGRSKVFDHEFSLYLKACEPARAEIRDGARSQHEITGFGVTLLILSLGLVLYFFFDRVTMGLILLLCLGFAACGLMFSLLREEIRSSRGRGYCAQLEQFLKSERWSHQGVSDVRLPQMPLWEEYRTTAEEAREPEHKSGTSVFTPMRIMLLMTNVIALLYLVQGLALRRAELSWTLPTALGILWLTAVIGQMLLLRTIFRRAEAAIEGQDAISPRRPDGLLSAGTWISMVSRFFLADLFLPAGRKRRPRVATRT